MVVNKYILQLQKIFTFCFIVSDTELLQCYATSAISTSCRLGLVKELHFHLKEEIEPQKGKI